jgi:hypothetical protein
VITARAGGVMEVIGVMEVGGVMEMSGVAQLTGQCAAELWEQPKSRCICSMIVSSRLSIRVLKYEA